MSNTIANPYPNIVPKPWGCERLYASTDRYCLKRLMIHKGHQTSVHRHREKDETFVCRSGHYRVEVWDGDDRRAVDLDGGCTLRVAPGTWHRVSCVNPGELLEVSTRHSDDDTDRREPGGRIPTSGESIV